MKSKAILWSTSGPSAAYEPRTIRALGHDEAFLEERIAEHPEILGLESLGSGIQGPFHAVRQPSLTTPTGRTVFPDVVLVSQSAHLIVVEVKLEDNPELANRAVVAQVVDYSAALAAMGEGDLVEALSNGEEASTLATLVATWFPAAADAGELADVLLERCAGGDIDLVIACDRAPRGLDDLGAGIDRQSALAFRLRVVEVAPWVSNTRPGEILFWNQVRARTEIVARTLVEVTWQTADRAPEVHVTTTSMEEVESAIEASRGERRAWAPDEIRAYCESDPDVPDELRSLLVRLLDFALANGHRGEVTLQRTVHPTFSLKLEGWSARAGRRIVRPLWSTSAVDRHVYLFRRNLADLLAPEQAEGFERRLQDLTGSTLTFGTDYATVRLERLLGREQAFERYCLELKEEVGQAGPR